MAINAKMLSKSSAPAPGGSDPMLDSSDLSADGMEEGSPEEENSELAHIADEDLMAECEKRGIKVQAPGEEGASGNGTGLPPANPFAG